MTLQHWPSSHTYSARLTAVQRQLADAGIAAAIIGTGPQFFYLTGVRASSHERLTALVVPAQGAPALVLPATDAQSVEAALPADVGVQLRVWRDGDNPYVLVDAAISAEATGNDECLDDRLAVGDFLTADHFLQLQRVFPEATFVLASEALAEVFTAKEPEEISELAAAAHAIDAVFEKVPDLLEAGRTERAVADDIEKLILASHEEVDFIIVGSGPNGANPHHDFSDRVLELGDVVVVDLGGRLASGYRSDCTRTFIVGGIDHAEDDVVAAYAVLERAQAAARAAVRPGVSAREVDAAARDIIVEAGFGEFFTHRTGHGIGLSTHEPPYIIADNSQPLAAGMAFSVEPGIYMPGRWGMRLEDIVVVTEDGAESLNGTFRGLL